MTNVGSNRVYATLLLVALTGVVVQMYRTFLGIPQFQRFALRVVTLFLEAVPFLLVGAIVVTIARELLPSERIVRFCRRRRRWGLPLVALSGLILPPDEIRLHCLAIRLHHDGLPLPHLVAAFLAIPLLNPVAIVASIVAFPAYPDLVLMRFLAGPVVAVAAGALVAAWMKPGETAPARSESSARTTTPPSPNPTRTGPDRIVSGTLAQFLHLARYFLLAAVAVGLVQSVELPASLTGLRSAVIPASIVAVGLAYLLATPPAGDAFIARGLLSIVPVPALAGFLIVGPMLNLRAVTLFNRFLRAGHLILVHLAVFTLGVATSLITALLRG